LCSLPFSSLHLSSLLSSSQYSPACSQSLPPSTHNNYEHSHTAAHPTRFLGLERGNRIFSCFL
jgi:hypothetical protein